MDRQRINKKNLLQIEQEGSYPIYSKPNIFLSNEILLHLMIAFLDVLLWFFPGNAVNYNKNSVPKKLGRNKMKNYKGKRQVCGYLEQKQTFFN